MQTYSILSVDTLVPWFTIQNAVKLWKYEIKFSLKKKVSIMYENSCSHEPLYDFGANDCSSSSSHTWIYITVLDVLVGTMISWKKKLYILLLNTYPLCKHFHEFLKSTSQFFISTFPYNYPFIVMQQRGSWNGKLKWIERENFLLSLLFLIFCLHCRLAWQKK